MAKSKEELIYDIENELVDPTTNKITGERVKARLLDMVDAMGTGGGGAMEYWGIMPGETDMEAVSTLLACSTLIRGKVDGEVMVLPSGLRTMMGISMPEALAVDRSAEVIVPQQDFKTVGDMLNALIPDLNALGFVPITKEVFYIA